MNANLAHRRGNPVHFPLQQSYARDTKRESKETYGQTRGLSNLELKHVGKLAIIGALLKAVKTSCVASIHRLFTLPLLHTYYKIACYWVVELQLNMGWYKL